MPLDPKVREHILDMPAARPPFGITPSFVNPHNLEHATYGLAAFFIALITVSVGIRIFTKWKIVNKLVVEDGMCARLEWIPHTC